MKKKYEDFGVVTDGASCIHWAVKYFFTGSHLHRPTECINILFCIRLHGSVTPTLRSGKFPKLCHTLFKVEILLCDSNGKQTQMLWQFVFDIKHGGKFSNHWELEGFANIYIS